MPQALMLALSFPLSIHAEDFTFTTGPASFVLSSNGLVEGLTERGTSRSWLASNTLPFTAAKIAGKWYGASAFTKSNDVWRVEFGTSGASADLAIAPGPDYVEIELRRLHNSNSITELKLFQICPSCAENVGNVLGVDWNDTFTVCLFGLSDSVNVRVEGASTLVASVYPEFGMEGRKVAVVAVPTKRFYEVAQEVEKDFGLPSPKIGGRWAKVSRDVRTSYLFTDLTESNVDETIRYAKMGGFEYVLIYSTTWASSLGSYPINTGNFPHGEAGLKMAINRCHAAGLKVGMHMSTSLVSKSDPLVHPRPDPRLLKDDEATLAAGLDEKSTTIYAREPVVSFPTEGAFYGDAKAGFDLQVDHEIIRYRTVGGAETNGFLGCQRGVGGTEPATHAAGAKIYHLAERYGAYLADLRTTLKTEVAERVAGLINRCGFDMIYFDGGECSAANGSSWYWVSQIQDAVCRLVGRDLLVQGSGITHWTWHWFARGNCDDFAAVATKEYLDHHKIADMRALYVRNFIPVELGWWGFLAYGPDHPATVPDEVEAYGARMIALDAPVSLETTISALKRNGRVEELLKLLGSYENLRLHSAVPPSIREELRAGEWHLTTSGNRWAFAPIRYEKRQLTLPSDLIITNTFDEQSLEFRLEAMPTLAPLGDAANIILVRPGSALVLDWPSTKAAMPGALARRIKIDRSAADQVNVFLVGPRQQASGPQQGKPVNFLTHRALAMRLRVEGTEPVLTGECAVLNVQLESSGKTYRDHYVDLDFTGEKTIIIPEPNTERMLREFRPSSANYAFKAAMYSFDYKEIAAVNLRWMRAPKRRPVACVLESLEALTERQTTLPNLEFRANGTKTTFSTYLERGDYLEYLEPGPARVFDENGFYKRSANLLGSAPDVLSGANRLTLRADNSGSAELTTITSESPRRH